MTVWLEGVEYMEVSAGVWHPVEPPKEIISLTGVQPATSVVRSIERSVNVNPVESPYSGSASVSRVPGNVSVR